MSSDWLSFTDEIYKIDINPVVDVPLKISQTIPKRGFVPVIINLAGSEFEANLVPVGAGRHILFINGPMLKATGWAVGDKVAIKLRYDPKPRVTPMSPELEDELKKHPKAQKIFKEFPPSRQKEINRYLNNLKSAEARQRHITKIINALEGKDRHMLIRQK